MHWKKLLQCCKTNNEFIFNGPDRYLAYLMILKDWRQYCERVNHSLDHQVNYRLFIKSIFNGDLKSDLEKRKNEEIAIFPLITVLMQVKNVIIFMKLIKLLIKLMNFLKLRNFTVDLCWKLLKCYSRII